MDSYYQKKQNGEPSPAIFLIYLNFVSRPQNIQETGQYEKLEEIKDFT